MKLADSKTLLIISILICWILIGINVYSIVETNRNSTRTYEGYSNSAVYVLTDANQAEKEIEDKTIDDKTNVLEQLFSNKAPERASPCNRVKESQIIVTSQNIVINFKNAEWATFSDTNSMDPVLDSEANAIEYVPKSESELCVGDIASYDSKYANGTIIHRIVETGYDENGWYAVFKGDNIPYKDSERVRFSQIKRVVIGIIY